MGISFVGEVKNTSEASPAVFLDRDGVLCEDVGYVGSWERVRVLPGALVAVRLFHEAGVPVVIVTNQSGIGRGLLLESQVRRVNDRICQMVDACGGRIAGVYFCPHSPLEGCACRKPAPGLLQQASCDLRLDPDRSVMVGDQPSDVAAGYGAGTWTVFLSDRDCDPRPDACFASLYEAVPWIVGHLGSSRHPLGDRA